MTLYKKFAFLIKISAILVLIPTASIAGRSQIVVPQHVDHHHGLIYDLDNQLVNPEEFGQIEGQSNFHPDAAKLFKMIDDFSSKLAKRINSKLNISEEWPSFSSRHFVDLTNVIINQGKKIYESTLHYITDVRNKSVSTCKIPRNYNRLTLPYLCKNNFTWDETISVMHQRQIEDLSDDLRACAKDQCFETVFNEIPREAVKMIQLLQNPTYEKFVTDAVEVLQNPAWRKTCHRSFEKRNNVFHFREVTKGQEIRKCLNKIVESLD